MFQSGSNSTSTGSSGSVSGSGKKPFFLHPPNETQGEQPHQLTGNGKNNGQQLPPDISSGHKILAGADRSNQGNLLKGIDKKNVRRYGFGRLHPLFTYVLFSVTHP